MSSQSFPENFIGKEIIQAQGSFTQNDAIIYALSIGFNQDPLKLQDLKYTYEMNENFTVFPTLAACFIKLNLIKTLNNLPGFPKFNPALLLHAEQRLQLVTQSIKPNVPYLQKIKIKDIIDKGKMTLVCFSIETYQKANNQLKLAAIVQTTIALLKFKANGYKGKGTITKLRNLPSRNPDIQLQANSYPSQAFFYRLTGDKNPLHVDPTFAAIQKFPKPIIHGMATKGIIARILVQKLLQNDPSKIKNIHVRFLGHVFPGESFTINVWKQEKSFSFQVKCKQRGTIVLVGSLQIKQQAKL